MASDGRTSRSGSSRRRRGSLSAEQILLAAQEVVEISGLHELSMPVLAKHLRSGVTSIYWYFRSKDELLAALTERVTRELYLRLPPIGDGPWDEACIDYFAAYRDLLATVPVYREVLAYRARALFAKSLMAPAMLQRLEDGLGLLVRAGFTADQAAVAFTACSNYTRGFVLLEHGASGADDGDGSDDRLLSLSDADFRTGLRLIIAGVSHQFGVTRPGAGRRVPGGGGR